MRDGHAFVEGTNAMRRALLILSVILVACEASTPILTTAPPPGTLRAGQRALVDDGTCPAGQVREVTGAQFVGTGTRQSRCIPRP